MLTRFLSAWLILVCTASDGESWQELEKSAKQQYNAKQYAKSAELYAAAIKAGATKSATAYNAACAFALGGNNDKAFDYLDRAIDAGYRDLAHLKSDADLNGLHSDKRWATAIERIEAAIRKTREAVIEPKLREELLERKEKDQEARKASPFDGARCIKVDQENTARMKKIVEAHGWPGKSLVGTDGAFAAWLLVQHADADPEFQAYCLELMKDAYKSDEVRGVDLAYLTDRVLVNRGKKQLYGTQFWTPPLGKLQPRPIEDEAKLDERRVKMGLGPFREYKELMTGKE